MNLVELEAAADLAELQTPPVVASLAAALAEQAAHCPCRQRGPVARFKLKINGRDVEIEAPLSALRRMRRRGLSLK